MARHQLMASVKSSVRARTRAWDSPRREREGRRQSQSRARAAAESAHAAERNRERKAAAAAFRRAKDAAEARAAAQAAAAANFASATAQAAMDADAAAAAAARADAENAARAAADAQIRHPVLPQPSQADPNNEWSTIDEIELVSMLLLNQLHEPVDPHSSLVLPWARVLVDILDAWKNATNDLERTPHLLFWRRTARGGVPGHRELARRFRAWNQGQYRWLLRQFQLASHEACTRGPAQHRDLLSKVLRLIQVGELSQAVSLLTSHGLADPSLATIVDQMRDKHPRRDFSFNIDFSAFPEPDDIVIDLTSTFLKLRRNKACGPDGLRNEHLQVLARQHDCSKASRVMSLFNDHAKAYVNGCLPSWYYYIESASILVPVHKNCLPHPLPSGFTPDARPIGVTGVRARAYGKALAAVIVPEVINEVYPCQFGVGIPNGISELTLGVRAYSELHPDHLVIKVDFANAFNLLHRDVAVKRLLADGGSIGSLGRLCFHTLGPEAPIILGGRLANFESSDGGRQGMSEFPLVYALATLPEGKWLRDHMVANGGHAWLLHDDTTLAGPPTVVIPAVLEYLERCKVYGGQLRLNKCQIYSPAQGAALLDDPVVQPWVQLSSSGRSLAGMKVVPDGLVIGGVPIGTDAFCLRHLDAEASAMCTKISTCRDALAGVDFQGLQKITVHCLQHYPDCIARHVPPILSTPALARVDAAVWDCFLSALGPCRPLVEHEPLVHQRIRLPVRRKGLGLRSAVFTAPAAFLAMVATVAPTFVDRASSLGVVIPGSCPSLASLFGDFDATLSQKFSTLISKRQSSPISEAFCSSWQAVYDELKPSDGSPIDSGPFACPMASYGVDPSSRNLYLGGLQRASTVAREKLAALAYRETVLHLPPHPSLPAMAHPLAIAFVCCDRLSTSFFNFGSSSKTHFSNRDFPELIARYLGLPSPACLACAGMSVPGSLLPVDPYGLVPLTAKTLCNKDGARSRFHDSLVHRLSSFLHEGGFEHDLEPAAIFSTCTTQTGFQRFLFDVSLRNLVPDLAIKGPDGTSTPDGKQLYEVKTMVLGRTRYSRSAVMQAGASKSPVEIRADSLQGEYVRHAKIADQMLNGVPPTSSGPFCDHLAAFGPLRGLVFGYYGEGSGDLHRLIRRIGNAIGLQTGRLEGAPHLHFARAAQINRLYREMSYYAHREQISYLFHALSLCGNGRRQATRERQQYYRDHAYHDRSAAY